MPRPITQGADVLRQGAVALRSVCSRTTVVGGALITRGDPVEA